LTDPIEARLLVKKAGLSAAKPRRKKQKRPQAGSSREVVNMGGLAEVLEVEDAVGELGGGGGCGGGESSRRWSCVGGAGDTVNCV